MENNNEFQNRNFERGNRQREAANTGNNDQQGRGYGYQGGSEPDRYGNTSYGKQYYEERDRNRGNAQGNTHYRQANDNGRRDYSRSQLGHNYGSGGSSYQNQGYGSSANGYRSDYGGTPYGYAGTRPAYPDQGYNQGNNDRSWWERTRDEVASWLAGGNAERRRNTEHGFEIGAHRGKGPRGYQRSQDRIREDVCDRLSDDHLIDATDIEIEVQGNEVILKGNVRSKAEKRRAEDLIEAISGVRHVENRLRINRDHDHGSGTWNHSVGL